MIRVTITKRFHRDSGFALREGMTFDEGMTFVNMDEAKAWAMDINELHESNPYHITAVVLDDQNFLFLDTSDVEWGPAFRLAA